MKQLMIIGTDTDVGKTYISGLILKKLHENGKKAAYFKAAMSGNERLADGSLLPGDADFVKTISGISQSLGDMYPYVYETAVSPHLAAKIEGNPIEWETIQEAYDTLCGTYDFVTVEGSGGILCPLRHDETAAFSLADFVMSQHLPCLLVADAGLGTLNHVGLTAAYLKSQNIPLQGIILNLFQTGNLLHEDNKGMCEIMTGVPVIASIPEGAADLPISIETLLSLYTERTESPCSGIPTHK